MIAVNYLMEETGKIIFFRLTNASPSPTDGTWTYEQYLASTGIHMVSLLGRLLFWIAAWWFLQKYLRQITLSLTVKMWIIVDVLMFAPFVAIATILLFQQTTAVGMNVVSRRTMTEQYEAQTRASSVMGYAVSIIIALVGVLNFVNSMVTAIIARKREFAMIQSIGMTKRQLRQMLAFEGLYYAGMTLLASYSLGVLTVGAIFRAIVTVADGFATFHFTLFPLVCCTPILIVFALLIPYLCFKHLERQSIVERLRAVE